MESKPDNVTRLDFFRLFGVTEEKREQEVRDEILTEFKHRAHNGPPMVHLCFDKYRGVDGK